MNERWLSIRFILRLTTWPIANYVHISPDLRGEHFINQNLSIFHIFSRKWKREQQKAEIMRGFPPTYLNGPNPGPASNAAMAANYMANLNKAAAYAAAAAAVRHNTMGGYGDYGPQSPNSLAPALNPPEDLTAEGRVRYGSQETFGPNVYAVSFIHSFIHFSNYIAAGLYFAFFLPFWLSILLVNPRQFRLHAFMIYVVWGAGLGGLWLIC
jgi:hypothetical protein